MNLSAWEKEINVLSWWNLILKGIWESFDGNGIQNVFDRQHHMETCGTLTKLKYVRKNKDEFQYFWKGIELGRKVSDAS